MSRGHVGPPTPAETNLTGLQVTNPEDTIPLERGSAVVCIPVFGGIGLFKDCLSSIIQHTPSEVVIVVADDATMGTAVLEVVREHCLPETFRHRVIYLKHPKNVGFVSNVNTVFEKAIPADVVVVNSDCVVTQGWYEGMRAAAYSDSCTATATALTNNGTIVSVPYRNKPNANLPDGLTIDKAGELIAANSLRIYPQIPTAIGHCMYIRRSALDLVGFFDVAFSPGYGEEVDLSQRCVARGLNHVVADDVFVFHRGGGSFGTDEARDRLQMEHEHLVNMRYPTYSAQVADVASDHRNSLALALGTAKRALIGTSVTIDATVIGPHINGTQLHVLELTRALSKQGIQLRVVVGDSISDEARGWLDSLANVLVVTLEEAQEQDPTDVVHRPFQVGDLGELLRLSRLGDRLVVTHQDLIAYRNPTYFPAAKDWKNYRQAVRASLTLADSVVCFSEYVRHDLIREGLCDAAHTSLAYIGVDHHLHFESTKPVQPPGVEHLVENERFVVCIGADYSHKNRLFALSTTQALREHHGWTGHLILVGPHVIDGSSGPGEDELLGNDTELASHVVRLGSVSEAEKAWIFERTDLLIYPTTIEGFGLVPFEAAEKDIPCAFAPQGALAEILPRETAFLVPWDIKESAENCARLINDQDLASRQIETIRKHSQQFRWHSTAERLLAIYQQAAQKPPRAATTSAFEIPWITDTAMKLIGPGGLTNDQQRMLAAIKFRPVLSGIFFGWLGVLHRVRRVLRRIIRGAPAKAGRGTPTEKGRSNS